MRARASRGRLLLLLLGLAVLAGPASAVTIDWVTVGDPGNDADTGGICFAGNCGSVAEVYRISKFEVTNAQYAEFLNAKAKFSDPLGLYNPSMGSSPQGGIEVEILEFFPFYLVKPGFANKPVNFVSFYDALRFINWLHNGQGNGDTETGAYTLLGGMATPSNGTTVTRNPEASVFLPSENEWYKAAYWNPGTQSFLGFPAGSNDRTVCAAPGAAPNTANCDAPDFDATDADVDGVTDVGAFTGSASPNGTFDQGGNVWEWTEQIVEGSFRQTRGGSWNCSAGLAAGPPEMIVFCEQDDADIGFRVATVPEPQTSLPAVIALVGLAAWKKRLERTL